jgi:hypothetical protein
LAATTTPLRPHVHGVRPRFRLRTWASQESDSESDDESLASPELMREAFAEGFLTCDIQEEEEELQTPNPTEIRELKQGSISKKLIYTWVRNRRDKVKPWQGPLPPPRVLPPRTIGDALAATTIQVRPTLRPNFLMQRSGSRSTTTTTGSQKKPASVSAINKRDPKLKSPAITGIQNSYSNLDSKGRHANHMG